MHQLECPPDLTGTLGDPLQCQERREAMLLHTNCSNSSFVSCPNQRRAVNCLDSRDWSLAVFCMLPLSSPVKYVLLDLLERMDVYFAEPVVSILAQMDIVAASI